MDYRPFLFFVFFCIICKNTKKYTSLEIVPIINKNSKMFAIKKNTYTNRLTAFFIKNTPYSYETLGEFMEFRIITDDVVPYLEENVEYAISDQDIIEVPIQGEYIRFDLYSFTLFHSNERNCYRIPKNRKRDWRGYFVSENVMS